MLQIAKIVTSYGFIWIYMDSDMFVSFLMCVQACLRRFRYIVGTSRRMILERPEIFWIVLYCFVLGGAPPPGHVCQSVGPWPP